MIISVAKPVMIATKVEFTGDVSRSVSVVLYALIFAKRIVPKRVLHARNLVISPAFTASAQNDVMRNAHLAVKSVPGNVNTRSATKTVMRSVIESHAMNHVNAI